MDELNALLKTAMQKVAELNEKGILLGRKRYTAPALDAADVARLFDHLAWLDNAEAEREEL